jgi:hypothetical protein
MVRLLLPSKKSFKYQNFLSTKMRNVWYWLIPDFKNPNYKYPIGTFLIIKQIKLNR